MKMGKKCVQFFPGLTKNKILALEEVLNSANQRSSALVTFSVFFSEKQVAGAALFGWGRTRSRFLGPVPAPTPTPTIL